MTNLKHHKTTFHATGSNHNKLEDTVTVIQKDYNVRITRTDLINIAISELYKDIDKGNKDLITVSSCYNIV